MSNKIKIERYKNPFFKRNSTQAYGLNVWSEKSKIKISPAYKKNSLGDIETGFDYTEVDYHREIFRRAIYSGNVNDEKLSEDMRKWYINHSVEIPSSGLELNIKEVVDDKGNRFPEDPIAFLRYRFMKNHPKVASSKKEASSKHDCYILNEEVMRSNEVERLKQRRLINKIVNSIDTVFYPMYLYIAKVNGNKDLSTLRLEELNADEVFIEFEKFKDKNPTEIKKIHDDEDNKYRYIIAKAIENGMIKVGRGNKYRYETSFLGNNLDEVIAWLKDPVNQEVQLIIRTAVMDEIVEQLYGKEKEKNAELHRRKKVTKK